MSANKRAAGGQDGYENVKALLLDIEGTTTSIGFVKDTLFPYVREHLKKYIEDNWDNDEFKADLQKLKEQAELDNEKQVEGFVPLITDETKVDEIKESLMKNVLWQMDNDRKSGALKQLQGHMWREAYNSGLVKGQIYSDVSTAFEEWTQRGKKLYIYSSGSVEAQKLLFGHTEHGDLNKFLSDYFDTNVGSKQDSTSYKNIADKIGFEPSTILFLTDVAKEAEAAETAGFSTVIVVRDGNVALSDEENKKFTTIQSFSELVFEVSNKRQKIEIEDEQKPQENNDAKTLEKCNPPVEAMDISEIVEVKDSKDQKIVDNNKTDEVNGELKMDNNKVIHVEKDLDTSMKENSKEENSENLKGQNTQEVGIQSHPEVKSESTRASLDKSVNDKAESQEVDKEVLPGSDEMESKEIEKLPTEISKVIDEKITEPAVEKESNPTVELNTIAKVETSNNSEESTKDSGNILNGTAKSVNHDSVLSKEKSEDAKEAVVEKSEISSPDGILSSNTKIDNTDSSKVIPNSKDDVNEEKEPESVITLENNKDKLSPSDAKNTNIESNKENIENIMNDAKPESQLSKESNDEIGCKTEEESDIQDKKETSEKLNDATNGDSTTTGLTNGVGSEAIEGKKLEAAQNGNSESNLESIKVKKVVEASLTDGETDVITPSVVAATS